MSKINIKKPFKFAFGIFLLIIGVLFLLINFNIIPDLSFIKYISGFWAIGLILAGILIILKQKAFGLVVLTISLILGCLLICTPTSNYQYHLDSSSESIIINQDAKEIELSIGFGAGMLKIDGLNTKNNSLVYINQQSSLTQTLEIRNNNESEIQNVEIRQSIKDGWSMINGFTHDNVKNDLSLNLNPNIEINKLSLDFGASESIIDLRNLNIKDLDMDFGASDVTIFFDNDISTQINAGASDIKMMFPKDKNIEVYLDGGLTDINLAGFTKINNKYYNNYGNQTDIKIKIDAGVSSIRGGYYNE